jgi:hypothetical protein
MASRPREPREPPIRSGKDHRGAMEPCAAEAADVGQVADEEQQARPGGLVGVNQSRVGIVTNWVTTAPTVPPPQLSRNKIGLRQWRMRNALGSQSLPMSRARPTSPPRENTLMTRWQKKELPRGRQPVLGPSPPQVMIRQTRKQGYWAVNVPCSTDTERLSGQPASFRRSDIAWQI